MNSRRRAFTPPALLLLLMALLALLPALQSSKLLETGFRRHREEQIRVELLRELALAAPRFPRKEGLFPLRFRNHDLELEGRCIAPELWAHLLRCQPRKASMGGHPWVWIALVEKEGERLRTVHPFLVRETDATTATWRRWFLGLEAWDLQRRKLSETPAKLLARRIRRSLREAGVTLRVQGLEAACQALRTRLGPCSTS